MVQGPVVCLTVGLVVNYLTVFVCVCVCVCVLIYATLWGTNVPTRMVKHVILDILGTCLWSPRGKTLIKNDKISESVTMLTDFYKG